MSYRNSIFRLFGTYFPAFTLDNSVSISAHEARKGAKKSMKNVKTIGLIGGMSWESTAIYYQIVNREFRTRLGKLHSAPLHLISLDFEDIASRQREADWPGMARILVEAAQRLEQGGAQCVLIGTNTMHKLAPEVSAAIGVPLLHIAEATGAAIAAAGLRVVGLLGTRFTMEQSFYRDHLARQNVECVIPDETDRDEVHRIIFEELCKGQLHDPSRRRLQKICATLQSKGAQGIVLGCTELCLILGEKDLPLPVFDTTTLHALAAVNFALSDCEFESSIG
jgi:aspartate racemase